MDLLLIEEDQNSLGLQTGRVGGGGEMGRARHSFGSPFS